jgi:hypothetical protein
MRFRHRDGSTVHLSPAAVNRLRRALDRNSLEVVTLNFGRQLSPDWTEPERLRYTMDLVDVLAELLPDDASYGSISTVPLAWRAPWSKARNAAAREAFDRLEQHLVRTEARTGKRIRIALEPEPGCVLEMIPQAADWLSRYSSPDGGSSPIGLGLDTCHLAVQFEEPADAFETLWRAGVDVVKGQLSAAAQLLDPSDGAARRLLSDLGDPAYLRQVREWCGPGVDDVAQAYELSGHAPWRVHLHVPVHTAPPAPLTATTGVLDDCLSRMVGGGHPLTHHLELETYAWSREPKSRSELAEWIAAELSWIRERLLGLGLDALAA